MPKLISSGYLDDRVYAESYLHSEVVRKGKPLLLIRQKLLMKGIDKQLLTELIDSLEADLSEGQDAKIAKEIVRLRAKGKTDPEIVQTLSRKGFAYAQVMKVIREEEKFQS